jgi:hypothetical protein
MLGKCAAELQQSYYMRNDGKMARAANMRNETLVSVSLMAK